MRWNSMPSSEIAAVGMVAAGMTEAKARDLMRRLRRKDERAAEEAAEAAAKALDGADRFGLFRSQK